MYVFLPLLFIYAAVLSFAVAVASAAIILRGPACLRELMAWGRSLFPRDTVIPMTEERRRRVLAGLVNGGRRD